jgi:TRAP-type C4-dicarboxylate transport system permease large subunit
LVHPGLIFGIGLATMILVMWRWKTPLPFALLLFSVIAALLAGFGVPFRHLVEGSFGYLNLLLGLFAGALFGQLLQVSGASDEFADRVMRWVGGRIWLVLLIAGLLVFLVGCFVGVAGVAVLAMGVFVVPLLRRVGLSKERTAAFIAVIATCGMIAPPVNVPAMSIADGVNMPYTGFELPLLLLSVIPALFTLVLFSLSRGLEPVPAPASVAAPGGGGRMAAAVVALILTLGFWTVLRTFPTIVPDPSAALVLVVGSLAALPLLKPRQIAEAGRAAFSGTPLMLAAVLVTVGIAVQIMTLTGIRGWLVISSMSLPSTAFLELIILPLFGSVLTSMGTANVVGVPFAFALIHQDMILNVSALSAISAISEFMPPTAIATALAIYAVGGASMLRVLRHCVWPVVVIVAVAIAMLAFADQLSGPLMAGGAIFRH